MDRRNFIKTGAAFGGALAALGPFQALSARRALGNALAPSDGYGPLVNKGAAYFDRLEGMWAGHGKV